MLIYLQMIDAPEEQSKFETLYLQYSSRMYRTAYSILRNEQDAEDAVHQAFLTIVENIEKISEPICPKTAAYVVTIVENKSIDLYRRKKRHPVISLDDVPGLHISCAETSELARCMSMLPARQRQVLLLKYHHGYSTKEISGMLSLSAANVAKIEQRAKAKLEQLCKEAEIL